MENYSAQELLDYMSKSFSLASEARAKANYDLTVAIRNCRNLWGDGGTAVLLIEEWPELKVRL